MDVVRVDDVQRLTFFRDTEEMVQGFSPRITVPGFGTFTTISIQFRYRNTVDADGQQALKVLPPALSLYMTCVRSLLRFCCTWNVSDPSCAIVVSGMFPILPALSLYMKCVRSLLGYLCTMNVSDPSCPIVVHEICQISDLKVWLEKVRITCTKVVLMCCDRQYRRSPYSSKLLACYSWVEPSVMQGRSFRHVLPPYCHPDSHASP
jgi:hypothetical protein